jgi:dihydroorotate dehydrogenase (NAD+) catalytic subunit
MELWKEQSMHNRNTEFYDPLLTFDDNVENGPFPVSDQFLDDKSESYYSFLGFNLKSPFGIPAGPLPTSKHVALAFQCGFDVVCYKTQRSVPFPANEYPNIVYLDINGDLTKDKASQPVIGHLDPLKPTDQLTITNSFGNPSQGPEVWVDDMQAAVKAQRSGQLMIASVVGTIQSGFSSADYYQDFANTALQAARAGAKVIEVNLSCPNVANEGVLCYDPASVEAICKLVKQTIGTIPLVAKIGYYDDIQQTILEDVLQRTQSYVSAYSAINTIPVSVVDEQGSQLLPGPGRLKSGACGASIKWAGIDMVRRLDAYRKAQHLDFEIIGVGGVMNAADFHEYRSSGANIVQSATGAMWNTGLAQEIKASLK